MTKIIVWHTCIFWICLLVNILRWYFPRNTWISFGSAARLLDGVVTQCAADKTCLMVIKLAPQIYWRSMVFALYNAACHGHWPSLVASPYVIRGRGIAATVPHDWRPLNPVTGLPIFKTNTFISIIHSSFQNVSLPNNICSPSRELVWI